MTTAALETIEQTIHVVRGERVMLDSDLAAIYQVSTKQLNQQLKRNRKRFPADFAFRLTENEFNALRSQIATSSLRSQSVTSNSKPRGGRRYLPWAFTENGALMLASVLNSEIAVEASVRVMRAFITLRKMMLAESGLAKKFTDLERRLGVHDQAIAQLFAAIRQLLAPTSAREKGEIGFHMRERSGTYRVKRRRRLA